MVAAREEFKKATAERPEHHPPEHEVQEIRGNLEDLRREMVRREQRHQEMAREMVRLWNVNADLLTEAISSLDGLKR